MGTDIQKFIEVIVTVVNKFKKKCSCEVYYAGNIIK